MKNNYNLFPTKVTNFHDKKKKTEKLLRFYSSRSAGYQTKPVFLYKAWKQNDKAMIVKLTK